MVERGAELGSLKARGAAPPAAAVAPRDPVSAFQELSKLKRTLPASLVSELDKRKVKTVEEAARVSRALRAKRVSSHKTPPPVKPVKLGKKRKPKKPAAAGELSRPAGKTARKAIASLRQALNSGVVRL